MKVYIIAISAALMFTSLLVAYQTLELGSGNSFGEDPVWMFLPIFFVTAGTGAFIVSLFYTRER